MKLRQIVIAVLCTVSLHTSAQPGVLSNLKCSQIDEAVRHEMSEQDAVGIAIAVIRDGQVAYTQTYGYANREKSQLLDTTTKFNWGSNVKPMTAVLILQLVDEGKLGLDDTVSMHIPEFAPDGAPVTIRQLLCHQSGLPHYTNGKIEGVAKDYADPRPFRDPRNAIDRFINSPLLFEPGTDTAYSSPGYILLSAIAQQAAGQPFQDLVYQRFVKPLKLQSFEPDIEDYGNPAWATGYAKNKDGRVVPVEDKAEYVKHGSGGYKSTIGDFSTWALALMEGDILSERARKLMWTPQPLKNGKNSTWGLGVSVASEGKTWKIQHTGKQEEGVSRLVLYPERRHGVAIMSNSNYAESGKISTAIYRALNQN